MTDLRLHGDVIARGALVDLAVNVVAGGPPPWLRAALAAALDDVDAYPDETAAKEAVAVRHGREPDEVVLVNGAAQAFWLVAEALRPQAPLVVHPSFTEPEVALRAAGRPPQRLVLDAPWTLASAIVPEAADLVVLGNPTNPTGVLHTRAAIDALKRPGRTLVVDEAFMDFVPGEPASIAGDREAIVIRSLTKLYAIPGVRAGYLLADPRTAARLETRRAGWSVNALALAATIACCANPAHAAQVAHATARARADLTARLGDAVVHDGAANFVLARLPGAAARLARCGIAVRPCGSFPGLTDDDVRVTVRDPATHALLARALAHNDEGPGKPGPSQTSQTPASRASGR